MSKKDRDAEPSLPADLDAAARARFEQLPVQEVSIEDFVAHERREAERQIALQTGAAAVYKPAVGTITPCGNGDLDPQLDANEWQGGYGTLPINFSALTAGLYAGAINASQSHQTWVPAGTDPNVPIPTTAQGSPGAVRIGNAVNGYGCELLSKTFIVTPAQATISFWYAVVLQDPGHPPAAQPYFRVRVTDASGNVVPGAFDFGNGSDTLVADHTNPFFQTTPSAPGVVYRDWSCAQIDLASRIGQQVTIEFVTADCGGGLHWGYAYIDQYCGNCAGSPSGTVGYDCERSTHCGPGRICFDYTLPHIGGNTGTVTITLTIYQNGVPLTQISSGTLSSGTSYCFAITPASIPGINLSLGGFDFTADAAFAIGTTNLGHMHVGAAPDGITPGRNNDYQIECKSCEDLDHEQDAYLQRECSRKRNVLQRASCDCPDTPPTMATAAATAGTRSSPTSSHAFR